MEQKHFKNNDSGFVCAVCGAKVPPLGYSSRNHCNKCLSSLHVDIMPGDRACECRGIMKPIFAEPDSRRGYIISQKCEKCGEIHRCRSAEDDPVDLIIELTSKSGEYSDRPRKGRRR